MNTRRRTNAKKTTTKRKEPEPDTTVAEDTTEEERNDSGDSEDGEKENDSEKTTKPRTKRIKTVPVVVTRGDPHKTTIDLKPELKMSHLRFMPPKGSDRHQNINVYAALADNSEGKDASVIYYKLSTHHTLSRPPKDFGPKWKMSVTLLPCDALIQRSLEKLATISIDYLTLPTAAPAWKAIGVDPVPSRAEIAKAFVSPLNRWVNGEGEDRVDVSLGLSYDFTMRPRFTLKDKRLADMGIIATFDSPAKLTAGTELKIGFSVGPIYIRKDPQPNVPWGCGIVSNLVWANIYRNVTDTEVIVD